MPNRFNDLGFRIEKKDDLRALLDAAFEAGEPSSLDPLHYLCWTPGNGIEVWLTGEGDALLGVEPHFAGDCHVTVGAAELLFVDAHGLDGRLRAWMNPAPEDPQQGDYPFICALVEAHAHRARLAVPTRVTLQLAAFAETLTCWPDDDAYHASLTADAPRVAEESFMPAGLFDAPEAETAPTPEALITGHILAAEQRLNPATGATFHVLRLRTSGNIELDIVADLALLDTTPVLGGVAQGVCWLSARVVEA